MELPELYEQLRLFEPTNEQALHLSSEADRYPVTSRTKRFGDAILQYAVDDTSSSELIELVDAVRELENRADYDQLTGLYRRERFLPKVVERLHVLNRINHRATSEAAYGYGIAFIDLDNFKPINDTYGHTVGDIVLRTVGERLRTQIRATDIAFRLGGDEFALYFDLLQLHSGQAITAKTKRIISELSEGIVVSGSVEVCVGASAGLVLIDAGNIVPSEKALTEQLKVADQAMYTAKRAGKNQLVVQRI